MSFWKKLARPIIGLSPMDGVTDQPFRHIQKKYGRPDIIYTEFTSVEGVCHGADRLLRDFLYDQTQRPIIAQIYGTTPSFFRQTAVLLCQLGFDGIDINMGCPAKNVAHGGAGAALIKTPKLAQEIVLATKAGVNDFVNGLRAQDCPDITSEIAQKIEIMAKKTATFSTSTSQPSLTTQPIPVSVKTRLGYDKKDIQNWLPYLIEVKPAAIAVHGRTLKQHYSGQADWTEIGLGAQIAKAAQVTYLGNGDISSFKNAQQKISTYGVDGALIGRASFGNPYVFLSSDQKPNSPSLFEIALEHAQLYEQTYSSHKKYSFLPMRKHLGWYIKGVPKASQIRVELFKTESSLQVEQVLAKHHLL